MQEYFSLFLFIISFVGGTIPLFIKGMDERRTNYLLAFSGSFLLSITLLHLLPETFVEIGGKAGLYLLAGFFLQLLIQRITHGVEHGHSHVHETGTHMHSHTHSHNHPGSHDHDHGHSYGHSHRHATSHSIPLVSILIGLTLHAFMEGLPLGFHYRSGATEPSLYLAVAAHKLPEAMLITSLVMAVKGRRTALFILLLFSLVTPMASFLAAFLGESYLFAANLIKLLIPVVAGAFIHIATTIFFESGTRQHMMTWRKVLSILLGVSLGLATLLIE